MTRAIHEGKNVLQVKTLGLLALGLAAAISASAATNYVDCKLGDYAGHDGSSWAKAFKTIQEGVDAASAGDTVLVAAGDYNEGGKADTVTGGGLFNRVFINRKAITLKSVAGAAATRVIGQHDPTTLNDTKYPGLGDNAIRCICIAANAEAERAIVEGFTFADGATSAVENGKECSKTTAGGVQVYSTSTGQYTLFGDIVDCVVTNCLAVRAGGVDGGRIVRCRIEDCDSWNGNSAGARHSSLFNCLVVRNGRRKTTAGAVEYLFTGAIVNCTFAGNAGQALGHYPYKVYNCLFSENGSATLGNDGSTPPTYGNCLVDSSGTAPNATCIKPADNFQLFAPAVGDYRLLPTSAAVGAGDVSALDLIPEAYRDKDFNGNPRKTDATVNIGCYETVAPAPEGGAVIFGFKASVNGFVGYCDKLHAYSERYPEMFDVKEAPGAYSNDAMYFTGNGGLAPFSTRWFPKWDDGRVGILTPASSYISIARSAAAQTFWVQDGYAGGDSNGTSQKPYATIQDAVSAAGESATVIKVRPGVYATGGALGEGHPTDGSTQMCRVASGKKQKLRIVSTDGPAATTILGAADPNGDEWGCSVNSYRCVSLKPESTSYPQMLQGFTLSGGRAAYYAGGAYLHQTGCIQDCIITNCISARAAAAYCGRLERCWVVDNYFSNSKDGTHYTYNDIAEQGTYICCVFSANRAPDQSNTHPIVGMTGDMYHCSGIDVNEYNRMTDSNVKQYNCIWDSFYGCTVDGSKLSRGTFAVNTPISNNGGGEITATTSPLSRALPACRIYASSPALFGGSSDITDYFKYATLDYEGNVLRFKDGKPTAGAFQNPLPSALAVSEGASGGISPSGEAGIGAVAGDAVTFTAAKVGQRPFIGMRVDGELLEGVASYTWTVPAGTAEAPFAIEAVYGTNWYVNANSGDDSRFGSTWASARKTLAGVMTNAISGDVVTAAPGTYDSGTMTHSVVMTGSQPGLSRVVLPQGVTLRAREGEKENTFIVGAPSSSAVDEYGSGPGAVRCVFMNNNTRLIGFTVTGGRVNRDLNSTAEHDDNRGAGVYCRGDNDFAYIEDCIISNNVAVRGAGCYMGRYYRCRITDNRAFVNGAAFRNARLTDCFIDRNSGNGIAGYICWSFVNSVYGANNVNTSNNTASDLYGFTTKASPMANSVILAGKVDCFGFASNTLYTSSASFANMGVAIGSTCRRVESSELKLGDDGQPGCGSAAIDFGDASFRDEMAGDRDVDGGQRIYNGKIDAGCCEFDWRPAYARMIGGRLATVAAVSPEVVRRADGKAVTLVDGTALEIELAKRRSGAVRYLIAVEVAGAGTLTVLRGGEPFKAFTAQGGVETFTYFSEDPADVLNFSFAGGGAADILSCRSPVGMCVCFQ